MVVIHAMPQIQWHVPFARRVSEGLQALGITHGISCSRARIDDGLAIVLGTSAFRQIEATGDYLLVDRCSFGDTNQWVTLVRNGHGRRGDHRVPHNAPPYRWERSGVPVLPWVRGSRRVLCGQTETYSPHYSCLTDWYETVQATHFRKHPSGDNPTGLPEVRDWTDCGHAITLNSSVAVDAILHGVPTLAMDEGAMAWPGFQYGDDREPWLHWLAWTQWSHDEISEGTPWAHML